MSFEAFDAMHKAINCNLESVCQQPFSWGALGEKVGIRRIGSKPDPKRGARKGEQVRWRDWGSPKGEVGVQEG